LILFCDTSALVKLYVQEEGSDRMLEHAGASEIIAVCRIAWVETMSALARRSREWPQDVPGIMLARQRVIDDWPSYLALDVTQTLVELAGDYADAFALRAYDSVQLAAVRTLHQELPREVRFACHDSRLVKAARLLGIESI
jgi:predicted nucleic acid-binding protein